ncbi:MAG: hypothetical protein IT578_09940, partial [Verrucomicrobiae bacterium]|nr:hypothetical protein [Verrucomicrobiae bacterium]
SAGTYNFSTNLVSGEVMAANSTNATPATAYTFAVDEQPIAMAVSVTGRGTAATTNGTCDVFFQRSVDGTNFEAATPLLKVSLAAPGATNGTAVEWYNLYGVKAVRVGRRENSCFGAVSNLNVTAAMKVEK